MAATESVTSYESIKDDLKALILLRNQYVQIQLIQNHSAFGFIHAIDPEGHSIILLEPCGDTFKTVLIPGHCIINVSVKDPVSVIKPVIRPIQESIDLVERREKLMSWLRRNQLTVTEKDGNIVLGSVLILPPYDITSIYSTNLIVTKNVRDIVEKMPDNFV